MKKILKIMTVFTAGIIFRQIPIRPPNVEPIMASVLPLGKEYGPLLASLFAFFSIVIHDLLTASIGSYTWIPALTYALIAILGSIYMRNCIGSRTNYVLTSVIGIIIFDIITGVIAIPLSGNTTWAAAFIGQIPFTALHLMGGVVFALTLSPVLQKFLASDFSFKLAFKNSSDIISEQKVI